MYYGPYGHWGGWDGMMGYGGWGLGFGWIFMLLFWAIIIIGIIAAVRWFAASGPRHHHEPRRKNALDILEERYARGEIQREEYQQKKQDLER